MTYEASRDFHSAAKIKAIDSEGIAEAAACLRAGGLVALPTETVYGLAGDATSDAAVGRIYAAKARPAKNPLIAHIASVAAALEQGIFSPEAMQLAEVFWPGPLTLVLPAAQAATVVPAARASLPTIALRVPAHPVAQALITAAGKPLAAPSANRSGRVSPVTAAHVGQELGNMVDLILDGGPCLHGLESTIIACLDAPPCLLRPGALERKDIEAVLGFGLASPAGRSATPKAPGQLASHYAPRAAVRLNARTLAPGEAGLDFGGIFGDQKNVRDLSEKRDLREAAANLFSFLRALDTLGLPRIAVAPIPHEGLGEAINDRLTRAAAPRGGA